MREVNDYDLPSWRSSDIFVLLRGTICAHAYLPNGCGYVSAGGHVLESWAKAQNCHFSGLLNIFPKQQVLRIGDEGMQAEN